MALYEMRKFVAPEFIYGVGARRKVGYYAEHLRARRVLVVTDPGIIAAGWLAGVLADLSEAGIEAVVFSHITPNPKDHEVAAGVEVYAQNGCDVIVALGGGSVIDCAKGIGIVSSNGGSILDYEGVDKIGTPGPPLICIPTTAGTSADISQFAIITNSPERYKIAIISKSVVPDVALIDPETTLTMDPYLSACTGLDALTHAIEAYVSTASSPVVDVHALAAIGLIRDNLETTITAPTDMPARENMMLASLQAGLAFSNASLGAVHAMAHSLGGLLDMPHGESNALLLDHVIRFNFQAAPERFERIGNALGIDTRGMTHAEIAKRTVATIGDLRTRIGVTGTLAARGVSSSDIPYLAAKAINDACIFTNPRQASLDDVKAIYREAV